MNTEFLKFRFTLWKDIKQFPTYNELKEKSKNMYGDAINLIIVDSTDMFYQFSFKFCTTRKSVEISSRILGSFNDYNDRHTHHVELSFYNFSKNFEKIFNIDYNSNYGKLVKFCYYTEFYEFLKSSLFN